MKGLFCFIILVSLCLYPSHFSYAKENATWIKSTYFRGYDTATKKKLLAKDVEDLAVRLRTNHIRYAYIFAGPYGSDGHLPQYAFSQKARESVAILKRIYPELKIFPWVGGVQNKTVHLERADWVRNAIAETRRIIKTMPVDGIHLDFEYVIFPDAKFNHKKINTSDYGRYWVKFHADLKLALPGLFISSVVVSTALGTKPWKHKHSLSEIKELSATVGQISFMFYETGLPEVKAYRDSLKEQMQQIQELKSSHHNQSQYLVAVGVFNEEKKLRSYRDLGFKNIPSTLKLLQEVEQEVNPGKSVIDGLAIFCEWMTTNVEWSQLRDYLK